MKTYESLVRVKEGLKELIDTKVNYLEFLKSLPAKTQKFRHYLNNRINFTKLEIKDLTESYNDFCIMTEGKIKSKPNVVMVRCN